MSLYSIFFARDPPNVFFCLSPHFDFLFFLLFLSPLASTANLETEYLFYNNSIHLGFYTTKDVQPGEELVSQYGEDYWKAINKHLIDWHSDYFAYIDPYTRKLEGLLYKKDGKLPDHPPDSWSNPADQLWAPKPLPYPSPLPQNNMKKQHASSHSNALHAEEENEEGEEEGEDEDGAYEVERILATRMYNGEKQFLVKVSVYSNQCQDSRMWICIDSLVFLFLLTLLFAFMSSFPFLVFLICLFFPFSLPFSLQWRRFGTKHNEWLDHSNLDCHGQ